MANVLNLVGMKSFQALTIAALTLCLAPARAAEPSLSLTRTSSEATVRLSGDEGIEYLLESASDSVQEWKVLSSFVLNDSTRIWREPAGNSGARFFRARTVPQTDDRFAKNFSLLDQDGMDRELYYYYGLETLDAVVLIFTEGNYSAFAPKISQLRTNRLFEESVFFWTIETGANNSRSNIVREAAEAGIDWPVLHDPMQFTAREYNARFNGEVFVIRASDMTVVYRGLIDDAVDDEPPANAFLATALSNVVGSTAITITRMEPSENPLPEVRRPLADYATVIAPLLQSKCVTCHSPGNIAPFALTNYQSVVENAPYMKEALMTFHMPPWHADPEYGKFKNDFGLSLTERATLVDWLRAGCPRTGGDDPLTNIPPPPPKWPEELGPPDQVLTFPLQNIPAFGTLEYRYAYVTATNTEDRWLRAAVVRPGNPKVVHHYNVWEGRTATALVLAAYSPGRTAGAYPDGTGWLLRAGMEMTIELHYTASGQEETDQPEIAFWYASEPPERVLQAAAPQDASIAIPPGDNDYEVVAQHHFPNPVRLYFVNPHMHLRGSRMRFELSVPGEPKRIIASIPRYHFHWQTVYHFDPPLDLPANSTIDVIGAFDNSHLNHHNPDPDATVYWGAQSWEEMYIGYMEYSDLEE